MKKQYIIPEISISKFSKENIVTESGLRASEIVGSQMTDVTNTFYAHWDDMSSADILSIK